MDDLVVNDPNDLANDNEEMDDLVVNEPNDLTT